METKTLVEILDEHLPQGQKIDFLSIDVEGLDFQVLRSNDWQKYRPEVVLAEAFKLKGMNVDMIVKSDLCKFVKDKGYSILAKLFCTIFFKREDNV